MTASAASDYMLAGYDTGGTLTYVRIDTPSPALTVLLASWAELTTDEISKFGGLFSVGDRKFMIGVDQLGSHEPAGGDKITDPAGVIFYVTLKAQKDTNGAVWMVYTTRAR